MASISFGGLATGLDTAALVEQLMSLERKPLTLMESDKIWLNNRLTAFQEFDSKLNGFLSKIEDMGTVEELRARDVALSSEDFFTATASSEAPPSNYQLEVVSRAQVQKDVSQGYASKTVHEFGTGDLTLTVGENDPVTIEITAENNSMEGIMEAINEADAGVTASVINDGTENPYRLVLTGENVATDFTLDFSGLTGGTYDIPALITTQPAQQAHIRVDNIDIYGESNTLDEAIPGVTLDLLQAEEGTLTNLTVSIDHDAIEQKVKDFISGYNDVVSFVTNQSTFGDSSSGVLGGNSSLNSIKRHLQTMLTERISTSGDFSSLTQLGLETQRNGTLTLDEDILSDAISNNLDSVEKLFAGEGEVEGIASRFENYLEALTDSSDGFLAGRKESTTSNIKRIDNRIEATEMRLEKREQYLTDQFTSLELLVSQLNAQGDYLTSQLSALENMWNYNK
jgi:flagellar hook-associated protein 2